MSQDWNTLKPVIAKKKCYCINCDEVINAGEECFYYVGQGVDEPFTYGYLHRLKDGTGCRYERDAGVR